MEFPLGGQVVLGVRGGGGLESGGHEEGPPCWAEALVEGWDEGRGLGTLTASWQARVHQRACWNAQTARDETCCHAVADGGGWEVGRHAFSENQMAFRTRGARDWVPRGAEEGAHEEGRPIREGPLGHGVPSSMDCGEGVA